MTQLCAPGCIICRQMQEPLLLHLLSRISRSGVRICRRKVYGRILAYGTAQATPTSDMLCVMPCLASDISQLLTPDY